MQWLAQLFRCRSYYIRQRILPGNITVDIFLNQLIYFIEQNTMNNIQLNFSLCDQAFLTAQQCAKKKSITHTSMKNLVYNDRFQAEYIFGSNQPLNAKIIYELLEKYQKTDDELINIQQVGIGAATTTDQSTSFYVLRIYPVRVLE